jgi:hypothetical protein
MGVIFAALSDRVADGQRGRAMGWIITGQSLSEPMMMATKGCLSDIVSPFREVPGYPGE